MSFLGPILSIIPSIAGVIGSLFSGKKNDYVKYSMPNLNGEYDDIYFEKAANDRIVIHNGCRFPIHVSLDATNVDEKDIVVPACSKDDITDMLVNHTLNNVDKLRITTNGIESNGANITAITCSGKVHKDTPLPVSIGKYVGIQLIKEDLVLIVGSECKLEEVSSLRITGEGEEPARVYENVTPGAHIPVLNDMAGESNVIYFPGAVAPFLYSQSLYVSVSLQCEMAQNEIKSDKRDELLAGEEWDFLRKGRCLN